MEIWTILMAFLISLIVGICILKAMDSDFSDVIGAICIIVGGVGIFMTFMIGMTTDKVIETYDIPTTIMRTNNVTCATYIDGRTRQLGTVIATDAWAYNADPSNLVVECSVKVNKFGGNENRAYILKANIK